MSVFVIYFSKAVSPLERSELVGRSEQRFTSILCSSMGQHFLSSTPFHCSSLQWAGSLHAWRHGSLYYSRHDALTNWWQDFVTQKRLSNYKLSVLVLFTIPISLYFILISIIPYIFIKVSTAHLPTLTNEGIYKRYRYFQPFVTQNLHWTYNELYRAELRFNITCVLWIYVMYVSSAEWRDRSLGTNISSLPLLRIIIDAGAQKGTK